MKEPEIQVGILLADEIRFHFNSFYRIVGTGMVISGEGMVRRNNDKSIVVSLNGQEEKIVDSICFEPIEYSKASFDLYDVLIGINFHWERKEDQRFKGKLEFIIEDGLARAINILSIEDYLTSVISSEMNATSSFELLKAHAVISRSWLIAQKEKASQLVNLDSTYNSISETDEEYIRWYDREEHANFDVCADDHCQRYQGITKVSTEVVDDAIHSTYGEFLVYDGKICDARFSKCCGGITERFENVWEPVSHLYLRSLVDNETIPLIYDIDLSKEEAAEKWIRTSVPAYCNTNNREVLAQVLNNYDQETHDFYRWQVVLTQEQISDLLFRKTGWDFGEILDLQPLERGSSGRLIRLKIVGSKLTKIIGKELFIRKALSESHLYSSAFVVDKVYDSEQEKIPSKFILSGAGWGHGVGLCQIGAAMMADKGISYKDILTHYFPGTELKKMY